MQVAEKPRVRVPAGSHRVAAPAPLRPQAFDAGKAGRRLRGVTTATVAINSLIRQYGRSVLARSRYLAANNPYTAAAKETFVSALVGSGIKPSSLVKDATLKATIQEAWLDWTDETDADGRTDLYGQQALIAAEMFEAGECFVRLRPRRIEDGLTVPFQLQLLPAEMLDLADNRDLGFGRKVEMGIEFDAIGKPVAYHFWRQHPGADQRFGIYASLKTRVPAEEVLHLFKSIKVGQIRGIPHTISAIVTAAIMDAYDDAELERKRTAALFSGFITTQAPEEDPLAEAAAAAETAGVTGGVALEPGATVDLDPGQDIKFAEPADVGGSYEAFQYRNLLRMAAGMGVPYAAMTGDLRQTSYGSIRAGLVEFRRRIESMQHSVMVFQFCRPVWQRFIREAVLTAAIPVNPSAFLAGMRSFWRVKWITPKWEWIDPFKDRQAEKLAVDSGFKARSDVIEAEGYDPEETDARIAADRAREKKLGLSFGPSPAAPASPSKPVEDGEDDDDQKPPKEPA
ncbi:MAG: phage portal protein [Mesorhizobium sp.]|uniref:phage portal protein n=1 Tax=Mesorhizobium sp. TaxID=1871066 RepID=UPI000FE7087D|nr:phage portal protein [Mesorhizobium sp.]RWQ35515.1 MAG: phage portal protein [Mesorhizobium sp.]RWQ38713.1 MAG: phage portal protein [Mesorhizobium sp.]